MQLFFYCVIIYIIVFINMKSTAITYPSLINKYSSVPSNLILRKVVVIHRHGDRSQISKNLGKVYPESDEVASKWCKTMPTQRTFRKMLLSANPEQTTVLKDNTVDTVSSISAGWDKINYPYAQLTEIGSKQLEAVGKELKARYHPKNLIPSDIKTASASLYCRSTSMCRTGQSLRFLLAGMFETNPDEYGDHVPLNALDNLPTIRIRPFEEENMYPHGGSTSMIHRRNTVYPPGLAARTFPGYVEFESRMKELLGLPERINWQAVMEVLHCHRVHGIEHVRGITETDMEWITKLSAWHWGVLYKDAGLNKLAIGRFIYDILADIKSAYGENSANFMKQSAVESIYTEEANAAKGKNILLYSGHDSTLVPVLCALGLYDDCWPPYGAHLTLEFATSHTGTGSTTDATGNSSVGNITDTTQQPQHYVRAVYNNQDMRMFNGAAPVWCPLETFWKAMEEISCSPTEFLYESNRIPEDEQDVRREGELRSDVDMTTKEIEEEIAASITGKI